MHGGAGLCRNSLLIQCDIGRYTCFLVFYHHVFMNTADTMPVSPMERVLTAEDILKAKKDPSFLLSGRMTPEALTPLLGVSPNCEFSEAMAEGTDSWVNAAYVSLNLDGLNLSGVTGVAEAKEALKRSLTIERVSALVWQSVDATTSVALEERHVHFGF